jgi:hypothetical protein
MTPLGQKYHENNPKYTKPMRKFTLQIGLMMLTSLGVFAQDALSTPKELFDSKATKDTTYLKKSAQFGLNFNQASFTSNWAAGGVNSVALSAFFNAKSEYVWSKNSWTNDFQSQYGVVRNAGQTRKSLDRIFFDSKYARRLSPKWNFFASFNFLSQFAEGFSYTTVSGVERKNKISGLFSPAFLTESVGLEYRPAPYFFVQFAPGAVRQTIVADKDLYRTFPSNYGVEVGKSLRNEVALMQLVANFDKDIAQNINLKLRYQMFSRLNNIAVNDIRFDALLTAKVNKYVNMNVGGSLVYFQDQSVKIQANQLFALGFLYNF